MADASCSGGTPFKQLIDHQSRDVSHHQDRLVGRPGAQAHGSFRSTPQPMQGQDGFGAFADGPANLPGIQHHQHHAASRLENHAAALAPAHAAPFLSSQTPTLRAQPAHSVDTSNWAADFSRFANANQSHQRQPLHNGFPQAGQQLPMAQQHAPQFNFQAAFAQPNSGFAPLYGPTNGGFMDPSAASAQRPAAEAEFDQEMSRWMASHGDGRGMEDVDAVMDQMARELEINDSVLDKAEDTAAEDHATSFMQEQMHPTDLEPSEVESLAHESKDALPAEPQDSIKAKSEVSEAAERLLETVQHEDGDKWKNSVFLSLMRDFRDGRKDIVDNEIRETPQEDVPANTASH